MIFGGTTIQTFILIFITMRCDWENEVTQFFCLYMVIAHIYMVYFIIMRLFLTQLFRRFFQICRHRKQACALKIGSLMQENESETLNVPYYCLWSIYLIKTETLQLLLGGFLNWTSHYYSYHNLIFL